MLSAQEKDKGFYSFRADGNVLGGFLEQPVQKALPTLAPVSLPCVGGFTTARSEGFTLDNIISCKSAYSRVSGQENEDGSVSIVATAVIEGLNLLEVVEADRIVAQLSIHVPKGGKPLIVSTAGSRFDGLRLAGEYRRPKLLKELQNLECDAKCMTPGLTVDEVRTIGNVQAERVTATFANRYNADWAKNRFKWMQKTAGSSAGCSLVDGFEHEPKPQGHVVEICGFGRFIFGELLVTPDSAQLVSIRAELGCPVKGRISINCVGGGGISDN